MQSIEGEEFMSMVVKVTFGLMTLILSAFVIMMIMMRMANTTLDWGKTYIGYDEVTTDLMVAEKYVEGGFRNKQYCLVLVPEHNDSRLVYTVTSQDFYALAVNDLLTGVEVFSVARDDGSSTYSAKSPARDFLSAHLSENYSRRLSTDEAEAWLTPQEELASSEVSGSEQDLAF